MLSSTMGARKTVIAMMMPRSELSMVLMVCSFRLSVFMSSALSAYVAIMPSAIYATQPSAKLVRHLPGASTSPSKLRRRNLPKNSATSSRLSA